MLSRLWPIMPSTVVMRRAAYEECGCFAEGFSEDLDFWIRIREQGEFSYLPKKLTRFTMGPLYPKVLRLIQPRPNSSCARFDLDMEIARLEFFGVTPNTKSVSSEIPALLNSGRVIEPPRANA